MAKITTKQAKEIMRQSMLVPLPAPYIIGSTIKNTVKRKISDTEKGLIEAQSYIARKERV